jgi:nucleoside diphosphate kinase
MSDVRKEVAQVGGILIKPDTFDSGVEDQLIKDIVAEGFEVVLEAEFLLDEGDVIELYPHETNTPVGRKKLIEYLVGKKVKIVAFRAILVDTSAIDKLQMAKGNKLEGKGLRAKYNTITINDNDITHRTSQYYRFIMTNNFHVFDSFELFIKFAKRKGIDLSSLPINIEL